jgi:MYXO-CTERM domain-containing protein
MAVKLSIGFVLLAACVTAPDEGELAQGIIGGQQASSTAFPTVVGLQHGNGNWFCSGVLIDKSWVLTAASCFQNTNATQARFDDSNINDSGGLTVNIAEIHKHPSFDINSNTWIHDVAMLKLAQPVDRAVSPLDRNPMTLGATVTQVGFGVNNNNGDNGGILRSLTTTTIDCAQAQDAGVSNANLLCFNAGDGTASCYGDGGSPAFAGGAVVGLGSGGTSSSCTSGLDLYTAIAAELTFIDSLVPPPPAPPPTDPPADSPDPTTPPPDDSNPRDPTDPDDDSDGPPVARGCSTGGGAGWLLIIAIAVLVIRRRRA